MNILYSPLLSPVWISSSFFDLDFLSLTTLQISDMNYIWDSLSRIYVWRIHRTRSDVSWAHEDEHEILFYSWFQYIIIFIQGGARTTSRNLLCVISSSDAGLSYLLVLAIIQVGINILKVAWFLLKEYLYFLIKKIYLNL